MITVLSVVVRIDNYYQILAAFNCICKLYICKYFFFFSVDSVASLLLQMKSLLYVGNAVIKSLLFFYFCYYYYFYYYFIFEKQPNVQNKTLIECAHCHAIIIRMKT